MNRDDIIRMAREAGLGASLTHGVSESVVWIEFTDWHDEVERFAALVAAATVARFKPRPDKEGGYELQCVQCWSNATDEVEDEAIRARGQNEPR